jgi:predicted nucleic acid-binding protein
LKVVADASVVVKWVIPDPLAEADLDRAARLLLEVRTGEVELLEPPHWLVEVGAVLARLRPDTVDSALELLHALGVPVITELDVYRRAAVLARELDHHLFDTLYHAVALETGATLVTADERYWRKASPFGAIAALRPWEPADPS